MKKILVIASSFPRYKDDWWQRAVLSIYDNMDLKKYHVTVVAPSAPGAKSSEKINGIYIERFTYFYPKSLQLLTSGEGVLYSSKKNKYLGKIQVITFVIAEFVKTISLLASRDFDVIHANWILPQGLVAIIAKFIFRKPVVITVHGTDVFALKKLNIVKKFILRFCDVCTANSSATLEAVNEIYSSPKNKIVYMGVDLKTFRPENIDNKWRQAFGEDAKLILSVGRLIKWKGFEYLVRAFPKVLEEVPSAKLLLIGKGPEEDNLKKIAQKLGLELDKNIFFLGTFGPDKLPNIYASVDIVVSPSVTIAKTGEKEGMGNVVLEARASGVPVIASRSGGLKDTVDGKTNGLQFEERDYQQLAKHIKYLLLDKKAHDGFARNGYKYVKENFAWKVASTRFCQLYETITR
ncbi:MAG: hypothetical protein A3A58_01160 [Candidatus Blackburnbacteria bacterium RIFCSPLOWO2_01_FULL_41_27]|uniref:Glycosyl transferase family 1 n=2 Tax=Candidatus Blackburniibacteriota TaxID=1817898 RepID=A0A1G1VBY8_9BACT|nr:MAG: hypothetical protein A3F61_00835 [Candidatus Blackburnbacteria bacterium RIFCSPHIGHO2_12_FULL_41_13b]OGY13862.1 MAG: hypothetical protein A3A58_01160 [Candidatus Blackburnbacteria bacterium RIFCSPLOWO2_01_FULL_41_27]